MCKIKTKKSNVEKKAKKKQGRPSEFNKVSKIIVRLLERGNYRDTAARIAGISHTTLNNWIRDGESGKDPEKIGFLAAVKEAESISEDKYLSVIEKAASKAWQASAWIMERKNYKKWGRRDPSKELINPEDVNQLVTNIILAINRTITDKNERAALAEEIARMGMETKAKTKSKLKKGKGNGNSGS